MKARPRYSIVIPVYNEQAVLPELYDRLQRTLGGLDGTAEMVFVNNGSADDTLAILKGIQAEDPRAKIVSLSRNFGHQAAVTAGLAYAAGTAVAILDGDLQDPPELLSDFFQKLDEGWDVAYGVRRGGRRVRLSALRTSPSTGSSGSWRASTSPRTRETSVP